MKIITTIVLLFAVFAIAGNHAGRSENEKQKPIATYRAGPSKVIVWENERDDGTTWKNFVIEKIYKKEDGKWAASNSFTERELLQLRAAIDKAISEEAVNVR